MKKTLGAVALVLGVVACGADASNIDGGEGGGGGGGGDPPPVPGAPVFPAALDTYTWTDPALAADVKKNPKPVDLAAKEADQNESVLSAPPMTTTPRRSMTRSRGSKPRADP